MACKSMKIREPAVLRTALSRLAVAVAATHTQNGVFSLFVESATLLPDPTFTPHAAAQPAYSVLAFFVWLARDDWRRYLGTMRSWMPPACSRV